MNSTYNEYYKTVQVATYIRMYIHWSTAVLHADEHINLTLASVN